MRKTNGKKNKVMEMIVKVRGVYFFLKDGKYTTVAGTLVYFLLMSVFPFAFLLSLLFGRMLNGYEDVINLSSFLEVKELLLFLRNNARQVTTGATFMLLITSLYSASNFFYHLRVSGEIVYGFKREENGSHSRIFAVFYTVLVMALIVLAIGLLVGAITIFKRFLPEPWLDASGNILLLIVSFFICAVLQAYIVPCKVTFKEIVGGSLVTVFLWTIASFFFSLWMRFGNVGKLYGAITAVIVFLLWLYALMVCFVIGSLFNRYRIGNIRKRIDNTIK